MASRGWYAEKMAKLKKENVKILKEYGAIEAIDDGNKQEDYASSPRKVCRDKADYGYGYHSLGTRSVFTDERLEYERKYAPMVNAINVTLAKYGIATS